MKRIIIWAPALTFLAAAALLALVLTPGTLP